MIGSRTQSCQHLRAPKCAYSEGANVKGRNLQRAFRCSGPAPRLPPPKILYWICIKSGADALANLPNLGKVVPARGCGHFGNETGRANVSPPRRNRRRVFLCPKRKSGGQAAGSPARPEIVCILVVDNTFDEFEVEICCQRTDGVDRAFSTSKDLAGCVLKDQANSR